MRRNLRVSPVGLRALALAAGCLSFAPLPASAGFFDFLFGRSEPARQSSQARQPQTDIFGNLIDPGPTAIAPVSSGRFTSYCVRTCDGKYFPLNNRGSATPAQMCQSFCPASTTKIYSGNGIDNAVGANGERYADMPNAFVYRKNLKADCTCNGRDPTGLAPIDLSLDTTLRPGDIVATSNGLVAYTGNAAANSQASEFTPIANYPGLTADTRAKLGEVKVAPAQGDLGLDDSEATSDITGSIDAPLVTPVASRTGIGAGTSPKTRGVGLRR
ncbi:MAG: DUF2865 domain-containing protein [Xanthobacteraceae bacterium]|nr:DUF2865 domain-containing protein [Xanthobacteraceae bacterium]